VWFLDPHGDARLRARPYLAHPQLLERIWEIDLTTRDTGAMVASWNPLSMEGRGREHIQDVVGDVVLAFASAQSWGDSAGRAQTILTKACETLAELAHLLVRRGHADIQPTIFQIRTLLTDEDWREQVIDALPDSLRRYWRKTFPSYPAQAVPVITNIIDRIDASTSLRAFLGSSRSTYDVRSAMDRGRIVFICPAGTGPTDRLISCLLIYNLFSAGLSRRDIPREERRPYYAWIDELTAVDGASKGHLAAITEQLRKYGIRLMAMTQMAQRLTPITRQAILQNQSILSTTAGDIDEANMVAKRWGKHIEPDTITELPKYNYVMSVTINGQPTTPFRVRGVPVEGLYADLHRPEDLEDLDMAVDANLGRRLVGDVLADLADLDEAIIEVLSPAAARSSGLVGGDLAGGRASGAVTALEPGAASPPGRTGETPAQEELPPNVRRLQPRQQPGPSSGFDWS
jgi:hypothetical protein